jgi:preprotein translocase subunit Sec63
VFRRLCLSEVSQQVIVLPPEPEMQKAFRKKSLQWHPDKNRGREAEFGEKFKELASNYDHITGFIKRENERRANLKD